MAHGTPRLWNMGVANLMIQVSDHARQVWTIILQYSHWKSSTDPTSEECVRSDSAVGVHLVNIDDVVQALQKDHHDARANWRCGDDLRPRCDVWVTGPREPEHSDR